MAPNRLLPSAHLLGREHWFLLTVLGVAAFFEGYDTFIVTAALPQIRQTFDLSRTAASAWLAIPILGAVPAVWFSRRADIHGRRRVLWVSIVGFTLLTGATAFSPNMATFVSLQFLAQLFLVVEGALAWTMVAEEFPAGARGFGFGWLAMLTAIGSGMSSILYGGVFEPNNISWRGLYLVALPPLAAIMFFRRRLPESKRFLAAQESGRLAQSWRHILEPPHRRWIFLVCFVALLMALTTQAGVFVIDFLQEDRDMSATVANFMVVGAGALAVPVLIIAGGVSDRYGRKIVGCSFGLLSVIGGAAFFVFARGAPALFITLMLTFAGQFGAWPTLGAFGSELFPTAHRALAGAWSNVARVIGQSSSYLLAALLLRLTADNQSISAVVLGIGPFLGVIVIWLYFPETRGRELEDISGEALLPLVTPSPLEAGALGLGSILEEPAPESPPDQPSPSGAATTEG